MGYEFIEREDELEAQASSSRGGLPPRKITGVGVLDPPVPPRKPPGPIAPIPASWLVSAFAAIILIGLFVSALLVLLHLP
jgi:hypothetical protein